jgi:hypothetical protein
MTVQVIAKAGTSSWLRIFGVAATNNAAWFDLTNGVTGTVQANTTAGIESVGSGWWRCWIYTTGIGNNGFRMASSNGATNAVNGTTVFIADPQAELGTSYTAYQLVGGAWDVTESGYPNVMLPYGDGGDSMSTGVVGFGTATQGLFADTGQNWWAIVIAATFGDGSILAQCGSSGSTQMFRIRTSGTGTGITMDVRGTATALAGAITAGALNLVSVVCTNGVVTARINTAARQSVPVGVAAAEAVAITFMARTATSPAIFLTGWGLPPLLADYAPSEAVESQAISTIRALVGGP